MYRSLGAGESACLDAINGAQMNSLKPSGSFTMNAIVRPSGDIAGVPSGTVLPGGA
jgi:hypothetical protein